MEVELVSHSVYQHIIPQIHKFKSALDSDQTRKTLLRFFDKEIDADFHKLALWKDATGDTKNVHRQLSEIIDTTPELLIVIDAHNPELQNASKNLPFATKISVFKTFRRNDAWSGEDIYHFETLSPKLIRRQVQKDFLVETSLTPSEVQENSPEVLVDSRSESSDKRVRKSPDPRPWINAVPDLRYIASLNSWRDICDHLQIKHEGNSARRVLKKWVDVNKPEWPPVPEV